MKFVAEIPLTIKDISNNQSKLIDLKEIKTKKKIYETSKELILYDVDAIYLNSNNEHIDFVNIFYFKY